MYELQKLLNNKCNSRWHNHTLYTSLPTVQSLKAYNL